MGDRAENLTRGGAAIAVSSGLVATMALPAHAIQAQVLDAPRAGGLAALAANLSGALATPGEITSAGYWRRHVREDEQLHELHPPGPRSFAGSPCIQGGSGLADQ